MKRILIHILLLSQLLVLPAGCTKAPVNTPDAEDESTEFSHDEIILGRRLENPYTVDNMKKALNSLYPTKAYSNLAPTDYYVRFLPSDDTELDILRDMGLMLVDHPVDYSIVRDGDYYHDPQIDEQDITWQYTVVPMDFEFPVGIAYEILDECYLSEHDKNTKAGMSSVDWEAVEREAFVLTGNASMLDTPLKDDTTFIPEGRIMIVDEYSNGGQPVGLSEVRIDANVFVRFSTSYTDRDGYYKFPTRFSAKPWYRLVFKNKKGFSIGINTIIVPASVSTLGKQSPAGFDLTIDADSDRKLFLRACANNSAYEYYERCASGDLNIPAPPSDVSIWLFDFMDASSTVMFHHGTIIDKESLELKYQIAAWVVEIMGPDITVGTLGKASYNEIYSHVVHELAHASHYSIVGKEYWRKLIMYVIDCALKNQNAYGDGSGENAGYCGVSEMWAYYLSSKLYKERYGGANPSFGSSMWFHPQIMTYLEDRGIYASKIAAAMTEDVTSIEALRDRLIELYPSKQSVITQIFARYE